MARSAFKAFLNLLPVLPALLVAFSCSREEYGPSEDGISHSGSGDGHLVFRAAVPDTKAALPSRDTIIALTENGEKSPLSLKVSTGNRTVASEGTKTADNPYGNDNLPEWFNFIVYSEDGNRAIDTDVAELHGDRWISRKDWSGKISSYTKAPTIHAWHNDDKYGAGWLKVYGKSFECVLFNTASGYFGDNDDLETPDHIWGYGVYSGLRADNSIVFRHVGAGVCVHCAQAIDMTVSALSIDARLEGIMSWTGGPGDISDIYSEDLYGYGVETLTRSVNTSLHGGNTWLVSRDEPIILPPQFGDYEGYYLALHLTVSYDGHEHTLDADISNIPFYSGSMTTLEVAMDSFLWIDAPDVNCVWNSTFGTNMMGSSVVSTNITSADFAGRTASFDGVYSTMKDDATDPRHFIFSPRWANFTGTDWTEEYTVSCQGVSSTGTVTVKGGDIYWVIENWNVPRYLFTGKTYDTDVRVRDINTNVVYNVAPFLMDWNYDGTYISIADGIITPVAQTPSVKVLNGKVNAGGSFWDDEDEFDAQYEVISPFLYCNPPYMEFAANQVVRTAVTGISRELRDTLVDGRRLWIVPEDMTVTFNVPEGTAKFSVGIEYYAYSGNRSLEMNFGGTNLSVNCQPGHHGDMSTTAYAASFSSASITAVGGPVAVDIFTIYKQISTVYSRDTWEVSSKSDWIMTWPDVGQTQGITSTSYSTSNIFAVVMPNTTGEARGGFITLSTTDGSGLTATIAVTQAAGSGWDFDGGSSWGTGGGTEVGF